MNLSITLFRRTGLTKSDIENIVKGLHNEVDTLNKEVDKTRRNMDFWKREMKQRQPKKKCTKCKNLISLWPFEEAGYYIKGNRVTHISCPEVEI